MSLIEPDFRTELAAHYSAVHARLWAGPPPRPPLERSETGSPPPPLPPPDPPSTALLPAIEVAAKWREIDMRLFGGRVSPKAIIYVVAAYFKVDVTFMTGPNRTAPIATARQCAMYVMRDLCHCDVLYHGMISFSLVAGHFGRHHSTAFHAVKHTAARINKDPAFAADIARVIDLLNREAPLEPIIADESR